MTATRQLLDDFADAFNRHDLDAVMSMMTDDCVFLSSAGDEVDGKRIEGQADVRKAFEAVIEKMPDAQWGDAEHIIEGDRALTRWVFSWTDTSGKTASIVGCDIFHLRDGKIWIKDTLRKQIVG
jgi:ketosteroid isomerase-like protein